MSTDNKSAEKTGRRQRSDSKKKRKRLKLGVIHPGAVYTREGLKRNCAIGPTAIKAAQRDGFVRPIRIARIDFFLADEFLAWIKWLHDSNNDPEDAS